MIMHDAGLAAVFTAPQRDALVVLFLGLHGMQYTSAETLWGVWLPPLAILVYRSGFMPRLLGVWLALNGLAYMIVSVTGLLLPRDQDWIFSISMPARLGEPALMLWLLIRGATPPAVGGMISAGGGGGSPRSRRGRS